MCCRSRRNHLRPRDWSFAENNSRGRRDLFARLFSIASLATELQTGYKKSGPLDRTKRFSN